MPAPFFQAANGGQRIHHIAFGNCICHPQGTTGMNLRRPGCGQTVPDDIFRHNGHILRARRTFKIAANKNAA
jgi:hypothetical protein